MTLSMTLLTILSGVALLLWGLRTVKRAVLRGYGAQVQSIVAKGTKNRITAFLSGIGVTMVMQSSVATTLLASSFFGRGLMTLSAGIAAVIGADIGSSLIAKILSFDLSWLAPLLLSMGIIYHLMHDNGSRKRFIARIIMGLGFVLTGLAIIREATAPLSESQTLPLILQPLESEPFLAILIAAVLTYIMHSGLSAVLIFAALAAGGVLSIELAIVFVIGANVGISLIPMVAVMKDVPEAVQIPLANIIMRMVTGIITLIFMPYVVTELTALPLPIEQQVVLSHIGFNMLLALLFMPTVGWLGLVCQKVSPAIQSDTGDNEDKPKYLDPKALSSPSSALSCATRETLHLSEILEEMLKTSYDALIKNDEEALTKIHKKDKDLNAIFASIKEYLIHLTREELKDEETEQLMQIMNFATNIEHAGDIIDHGLCALAQKKINQRHQFSDEGVKEIKSIHKKVTKNVQLAQNIFLSSDPELAKQLVHYKRGLKDAEIQSATNHIQRLKEGLPQTVATSGIHMDVIRDLRRVNTYITSVAYGILSEKKA